MHDIRNSAPPAVPNAIQIKRPQIAKDRPPQRHWPAGPESEGTRRAEPDRDKG